MIGSCSWGSVDSESCDGGTEEVGDTVGVSVAVVDIFSIFYVF